MRKFITLLLGGMLMGQTAQDFTRLYDSYLAAVRSGDFRVVSAMFTQELRAEIKTPEDQQEYMMMAKYMAPESYETLFLTMADGGRKAELQVVITVRVPEEIQKQEKIAAIQRAELILNFVKEDGQWKWGAPTILGDPDQRARPKDLNMGVRSDYRDGSNMQLSGQVLRVEKQAAGTVFVTRVLDEEIAAFVPAAKVSGEFAAGCVLVFQGAEHKSDKLKFWADEVAPYER
jgi:hypothetical protein